MYITVLQANNFPCEIQPNADSLYIVKERMLVAYIPLLSVDTEKKDNEYTYRTTGRGSVNYELIQEGSTELKTIQS